jgi:hypothetical protein
MTISDAIEICQFWLWGMVSVRQGFVVRSCQLRVDNRPRLAKKMVGCIRIHDIWMTDLDYSGRAGG